jgi:F1F0 ATPase subunit 2
MVSEATTLALAVAVGGALGAFFFGGLWWTVRRGLTSSAPAPWFFGSLLLRTGVTVIGFGLVSGGHWDRMLACLLGFFIARVVVARVTQGKTEERPGPGQGADHAP